MNVKGAEKTLIESRRRRKKRTGPPSLDYTEPERIAVQTLAANCHIQASIAGLSGLSISQFKRGFEADPKVRAAWEMGVAQERVKIEQALLRTALSPSNPRQVQAATALLKSRHGVSEGGGSSVSVNVQNVFALPAPQDARKYQAIIKRTQKHQPSLIEHETQAQGARIPTAPDPIATLKRKQWGDAT